MIDYLPQDASQGYNPVLIHITNAIEETKDFASKGDVGPLLDTLSGSFEIMKKDLSWCLDSTGRRIDGNLVLKHVHTFRSRTSKRISATDLLTLPIRLCPHQSTATHTPESSRYINGRSAEQNASAGIRFQSRRKDILAVSLVSDEVSCAAMPEYIRDHELA
ncbi:unnamed protein product [Alternaria alternata]